MRCNSKGARIGALLTLFVAAISLAGTATAQMAAGGGSEESLMAYGLEDVSNPDEGCVLVLTDSLMLNIYSTTETVGPESEQAAALVEELLVQYPDDWTITCTSYSGGSLGETHKPVFLLPLDDLLAELDGESGEGGPVGPLALNALTSLTALESPTSSLVLTQATPVMKFGLFNWLGKLFGKGGDDIARPVTKPSQIPPKVKPPVSAAAPGAAKIGSEAMVKELREAHRVAMADAAMCNFAKFSELNSPTWYPNFGGVNWGGMTVQQQSAAQAAVAQGLIDIHKAEVKLFCKPGGAVTKTMNINGYNVTFELLENHGGLGKIISITK
jgi:hypothetical protein